MIIDLITHKDLIKSHETRWGRYISHSYDVDIGNGVLVHIIEEVIDHRYAYFKMFYGTCMEVIHHVFQQPRDIITKRFTKRIEIVGARGE